MANVQNGLSFLLRKCIGRFRTYGMHTLVVAVSRGFRCTPATQCAFGYTECFSSISEASTGAARVFDEV